MATRTPEAPSSQDPESDNKTAERNRRNKKIGYGILATVAAAGLAAGGWLLGSNSGDTKEVAAQPGSRPTAEAPAFSGSDTHVLPPEETAEDTPRTAFEFVSMLPEYPTPGSNDYLLDEEAWLQGNFEQQNHSFQRNVYDDNGQEITLYTDSESTALEKHVRMIQEDLVYDVPDFGDIDPYSPEIREIADDMAQKITDVLNEHMFNLPMVYNGWEYESSWIGFDEPYGRDLKIALGITPDSGSNAEVFIDEIADLAANYRGVNELNGKVNAQLVLADGVYHGAPVLEETENIVGYDAVLTVLHESYDKGVSFDNVALGNTWVIGSKQLEDGRTILQLEDVENLSNTAYTYKYEGTERSVASE